MRHDEVLRNEDTMLNEGQLLALRFSAMFAQCQQGQGAYDDSTKDEQANAVARQRAAAVSAACQSLLEDTADIACGQALARRGLEPDELDMLYEEETEWEPVQAGVPKEDGYKSMMDEISATDRSRNNDAFDAFVNFAKTARQYGLAGALPPIEGVDKYSVGDQKLSAEDFADLADTTDVAGVDPDGLYDIKLFGIEISRGNAFDVMHKFAKTFEPDDRSEMLELIDSYGRNAKVQAMLFQHETQPVEDVMKEAGETLGVSEYA